MKRMKTIRLEGYRAIFVNVGTTGELERVGESSDVEYRAGHQHGHESLPQSVVRFSIGGSPNDALRRLIDMLDERRRNLPIGGLVNQDAPKFTLRIIGRDENLEFRETRFEIREKGKGSKYHSFSVEGFSETLPNASVELRQDD